MQQNGRTLGRGWRDRPVRHAVAVANCRDGDEGGVHTLAVAVAGEVVGVAVEEEREDDQHQTERGGR